MPQVTIYHNPRCSKSRETLQLIEDRGLAPTVVEYLKAPPTADELTRILALLGKKPAEIVRKKEAAEAGIDPAALSDAELVRAMVAHPAIIERPIVVAGDKAALGRPPESVLAIL
ncbi:MAG: arsenate reductase (glutaredoxin) [Bacteroidales bacterium]